MAISARTRIAGLESPSVQTSGAAHTPERRAIWPTREVMDIRQASDYLGISADSLYKYASEGFIPAFKLGNRWRFKRSLMERWMEQQSIAGPVTVSPKSAKTKQKKPVSRAR